jgi:YHS domain-containing protein
MFQLILLAAIVYFLLRWVRQGPGAAARPRSPDPRARQGGPVEEMAQDPVCGTWVPLSQAIALGTGSGTRHFCSEECRDKFLGKGTNG